MIEGLKDKMDVVGAMLFLASPVSDSWPARPLTSMAVFRFGELVRSGVWKKIRMLRRAQHERIINILLQRLLRPEL